MKKLISIIYHRKGLNRYNHNDKTYGYTIINSLISIRLFNKYYLYIKL